MGKSTFFDEITGLPIKSSRIHDKAQDAVAFPSFGISPFPNKENVALVRRAKRRSETLKQRNSYFRCTRKMGKSTFFDENGLPLIKPRMQQLRFNNIKIAGILPSSEISEVENIESRTAKTVPLAGQFVQQFERRKHFFFDAHTGLKIEKSHRASLNLNDIEEVVTESSFESSQIQEPENVAEEVPPTEESVGDLGWKRRKRGKRKRIQYCEPFDEPVTIEKLPFEVLEIILSKVSSRDRKNCRLVSKLWYNALCKHDEYIAPITLHSQDYENFEIRNTIARLIDLENTELKHLHLNFKDSDLKFLSENFWNSMAGKIYSLKLVNCRLCCPIIKTVIKSCKKLQYLKISLQPYGTFCMPETLEKMNIVRKKLKTFDFCVTSIGNMDQEHGARVFAALFRIFPNIENYTFSIALTPGLPPSFKCSFTKVSSNQIADELQLSLMFSLLLSVESTDWKKMLGVLSAVRLLNVSLQFSSFKVSQNERLAIVDFFANQKALKTVKLLPYDGYNNQLKLILFEILESCSELCELVYCPSRKEDCTQNLTRTEWSYWSSKLSKLKKLSICSFIIDNAPSLPSLSSNPVKKIESAIELRDMFGRSLMFLFQTFTHLQHLILVDNVSDLILQTIFQYLTGLKTLDIHLGINVTEVGFIGHQVGCKGFQMAESSNGYSISRLENLERLVLHKSIEWSLKDVIFSVFNLPKLTYLDCFLPIELWSLLYLSANLPLLRTAKFSSTTKIYNLVGKLSGFCYNTGNLETVTIDTPEDELLPEDTKCIFEVCPTLKTLRCNQRTYYWLPSNRKMLLKHPDNPANNHYFFMD